MLLYGREGRFFGIYRVTGPKYKRSQRFRGKDNFKYFEKVPSRMLPNNDQTTPTNFAVGVMIGQFGLGLLAAPCSAFTFAPFSLLKNVREHAANVCLWWLAAQARGHIGTYPTARGHSFASVQTSTSPGSMSVLAYHIQVE